MGLDELYEGLLEEGISPIVYHNTSVKNLFNILATNKFMLSCSELDGLDSHFNATAPFFLSTSRTRTGSYRKANFPFAAFITLNGRRLAQNYKGVAVDFYGKRDKSRTHHHDEFEQEDRILSKTNTITNFSSYMIRIELFSKTGLTLTEKERELLYDLSKNIPVYIYRDEQSFLTGNKRRADRLCDPEAETLF